MLDAVHVAAIRSLGENLEEPLERAAVAFGAEPDRAVGEVRDPARQAERARLAADEPAKADPLVPNQVRYRAALRPDI